MNKQLSLVKIAQLSIAEVLCDNDFAIDATAGNGYDTLFLANHVSGDGHVFAFDVQQAALDSTHSLLGKHNCLHKASLFKCGHELIQEMIPGDKKAKIKTVMYNLGYLPGSDKSVITQPDSTLLSLQSAINLIAKGGRITLVAYTGHPGGYEETEVITNWCRELPKKHFSVNTIITGERPKNRIDSTPKLIIIDKLEML